MSALLWVLAFAPQMVLLIDGGCLMVIFYDEDIAMEGGEGESLMVLDLMANCPASIGGKFYRFAGDACPRMTRFGGRPGRLSRGCAMLGRGRLR